MRSQTLLYNIGITQERSPVSKMNVRKFSGRAAITRHPKAHVRDSVSILIIQKSFYPSYTQNTEGLTEKMGTDTETSIRSDVSANVRLLILG